MSINHREFWHPIQWGGGSETIGMRALVCRYECQEGEEPWNLDPDYQRDHVWTDEQAGRFVGHLISGGAVPPVIINRDPTYEKPDEVVDGKQRLTACYRWMKGEIPAILHDNREIRFSDLDEESQRYLTSMTGPVIRINYGHWSREEVLDIYLKLNSGGTVHTPEEIERVRGLLAAERG